MSRTLITAALLLWTPAALAEMTCTFETECFEADGCQSSAFEMSVAAGDDDTLTATTEFGDLEVLHFTSEPGALSVFARDGGGAYLLSNSEDGARMTVHVEGPLAVTYLGACEGVL